MSKLERIAPRKSDKVDKKAGMSLKPTRATGDLVPPDFNTFFDPIDVDLGLQDTGDPEQNVNQEVSAALAAVLGERAERKEIYRNLIDVNYYFCVCFQNEAQKLEFMQAAGWRDMGEFYIDGLELARRVGVEIAPIMLPKPNLARIPKDLRGHGIIETSYKEV